MASPLPTFVVRYIVSVAFFAIVAGDAFAQSPVKVTVSSRNVTVSEGFSITVTAHGSQVSDPEIPNADGLRIDRDTANVSRSTSMSIINGRTSVISKRSWTYTAWPTRAGKLTVPRIKVEVDGKSYLTEQVIVTAQSRRRGAESAQRANTERSITLEDAFFITSSVDKPTAYQGEPIKLTLSIWELSGYGIRGDPLRQNLPLPTTEGFYNGPIIEGSSRQSQDGLDYSVKYFEMFVYPTETGAQTIGSWEWDGYVHYRSNNSIFGRSRVRKSYRTDPISITVKPLPAQPDGFSGAVGEFSVRGTLRDKDAVQGIALNYVVQGIPLHYVVQVAGEGNPDAIGALEIPDLSWAHVSEATSHMPEVDPFGADRILKEFMYRIVPLETGEQRIPALQFVYFSPSSKDYRVENIPEVPLFVKASGERETLVAIGGTDSIPQRKVQILSEDVLPIISVPGRLRPRRSSVPTVAFVTVVPPLFYAALFLYCRRSRRLVEDTEYARNHRARSKGEKRLKGMDTTADPMASLYRALIGFLADKFNINDAGLTSSDAGDALKNRGIDAELSAKFVKVLKTCERTRYARATLRDDEVHALKHGAIAAMDELEKFLRKEKRG